MNDTHIANDAPTSLLQVKFWVLGEVDVEGEADNEDDEEEDEEGRSMVGRKGAKAEAKAKGGAEGGAKAKGGAKGGAKGKGAAAVLALVHTRTLKMGDDVTCVRFSKSKDPTKALVRQPPLVALVRHPPIMALVRHTPPSGPGRLPPPP